MTEPLAEAAPVPFGRWMPSYVVRDMHQLEHGGRTYFLGITVTAELIGEEPAGGPLPVRADLARRIADLVRADCAVSDLSAELKAAPGAEEMAPEGK